MQSPYIIVSHNICLVKNVIEMFDVMLIPFWRINFELVWLLAGLIYLQVVASLENINSTFSNSSFCWGHFKK